MESKQRLEIRILLLKANLIRTDYQAIKYAEGELTEEEYAETKAARKAWRAEINELQAKLEELKAEEEENGLENN